MSLQETRTVANGMTRDMKRLILGLCALTLAGAAFSAYSLRRPAEDGADVQVITRGEEVDITSHLAPGKYTVFDFYAVWCPPCRILGPALERLAAQERGRLAIRKVDIVDWTMPVATQYQIESLPHLVLFDDGGHKVAEGEEVFAALQRIFGETAREVGDITGVAPQSAPVATEGKGGIVR
jgi:thiol-disulfide isomerase/thioredoxin